MQSYRDPAAKWMGSPNFTRDRNGHDMAVQPAWVVLHTMVGTVASADARFQQKSQQASAHYGVGLDGALYQWVDEKDSAWTNGNSAVEGAIGRNEDSVTIEHEDGGRYDDPRPDALYEASAPLVRRICKRYRIPIDRQHVIGHRECTGNAPTACPDALDVERIVAMAAAGGEEDLANSDDILKFASDADNIVRYGSSDPELRSAWLVQFLEEWKAGLSTILAAQSGQLAQLLGDDDAVRKAIAGLTAQLSTMSSALADVRSQLTATQAELDAIKVEVEAGGSVDAASAIARIEAALRSA